MQLKTQSKIERYHRAMKNRILIEHYNSSEELERALWDFIDMYNNDRLQESLNNLAPTDVSFNMGRKNKEKKSSQKNI